MEKTKEQQMLTEAFENFDISLLSVYKMFVYFYWLVQYFSHQIEKILWFLQVLGIYSKNLLIFDIFGIIMAVWAKNRILSQKELYA